MQISKAHYDPDRGVTLYYHVPEANTFEKEMEVQGFMFIYQYQEGDESLFPTSSFTPQYIILKNEGDKLIRGFDPNFTTPEPITSRKIGDIEWNYYSDTLWRGQKDKMYYEIQLQGNFSMELMTEFLQHFQPTDAVTMIKYERISCLLST